MKMNEYENEDAHVVSLLPDQTSNNQHGTNPAFDLDDDSLQEFIDESEILEFDAENTTEIPIEDGTRSENGDNSDNRKICNFCGAFYSTISDLSEHISDKHFNYSCDNCTTKFPSEKLLRQHLSNAHLPSRNIACPICGQIFSTKYNAQQHFLTHSETPSFECKFSNCKKKFRHFSSFRAHERVHLNQNRKECPICHKNFTLLSLHILTHNDDKPFKCNQCGKSFTRKSALIEHENAHAGIVYGCDICNATFRRKGGLYKHTHSQHSSEQYVCPETSCQRSFNRKDNLNAHIMKVHKLEIETKNQIKRK